MAQASKLPCFQPIFLLGIHFILNVAIKSDRGKTEWHNFCLNELFNISCGNGYLAEYPPSSNSLQLTERKVLLVERALFGRMRPTRCTTGVIQMDCWKDLTEQISVLCSGFESCSLPVQNLLHHHPCHQDFLPYLSVLYSCVTVHYQDNCEQEISQVKTEEGLLMLQAGKPCPWFLSCSPGKKMRLSLVAFNQEKNSNFYDSLKRPSCRGWLVVDRSCHLTTFKQISCCSLKEKSQNDEIYLSQNHEMCVVSSCDDLNFLLQFKGVGCPLPQTPQNSYLVSLNDHTAQFACNTSRKTLSARCRDGVWSPILQNCSSEVHIEEKLYAKEGRKKTEIFGGVLWWYGKYYGLVNVVVYVFQLTQNLYLLWL